MAAQYKIVLSTPAGVKQHEFVDFDFLTYTKRLHTPGNLRFRVGANSVAAPYLVDRAQVEVYRRNTAVGLDWYVDYVGLVRDDVLEQDENGRDMVTALRCPGILHLLEHRIVDFKSGVANKSAFTSVKGETLLKTLVTYNITSSATTANGRNSDGTMASPISITVQADGAAGNTIGSWGCSFASLLEELKAVAKVAGGDFDLIRASASSFVFNWYLGQRGSDLRTGASLVKFATKLGNMAKPKLMRERTRIRTKAIVAGAASGTAREYTTRTGNGYASDNVIETFVDARNLAAGSSLNAEGDKALADYKQQDALTFSAIQMPSCYYGKHYAVGGALGDLVNVEYRSYSAAHKITGVTVTFDEGGEKIDPETEFYA